MLAFVLHGLMGDWTQFELKREARILDPYECVSADGTRLLHVEPSERGGRGPSTVFLLEDGRLAWIRELPFTLREAVVHSDGAVLGYAEDEKLWFCPAIGGSFRELAPPHASIPKPMVLGLLDIAWEDAVLVRVREQITDATGRGRAERWWRFEFDTNEWGPTAVPEVAIGQGFSLLFADRRASVLVASEAGPDFTVWTRALDSHGCTLGLRLLGGMGFDPVELEYQRMTSCGNALRAEGEWLRKLDTACSWGSDLSERLLTLSRDTVEGSHGWPRTRLNSLGRNSGVHWPTVAAVNAPAGARRRLDGSWINEIDAVTNLPDGGYALVDWPRSGRGERFARLLITDPAGTPLDQQVLPFAGVSQITARGDWIAVVPNGRPSVALLNRRTHERFELLTRTSDRDARAELAPDGNELTVLDQKLGMAERFRLAPR